eukprot:4327581-Prymnesium_polylepis.1
MTATAHTRGLSFVRPSGHVGLIVHRNFARRPAFSHGAHPRPARRVGKGVGGCQGAVPAWANQRGPRAGHHREACGAQRQPTTVLYESNQGLHAAQDERQPRQRHGTRRWLTVHGGGQPRRVR